jgi:hypothetical protein
MVKGEDTARSARRLARTNRQVGGMNHVLLDGRIGEDRRLLRSFRRA